MKKTILFVDDDPTLVSLFRKVFQDAGFAVLTAFDGAKGFDTAINKHPDIVVLDISMPVLGGLGVLKKLRADKWGKSVPIIMLTSFDTTEETLGEITEYKPTYYFLKEKFGPTELMEKIKGFF